MEKDNITYLLREIIKRVHANAVKRLKKYNITFSQYMVLMLLYHDNPLSMSEVNKELLISQPAATILVDKLVKKGLVERNTSKEDRRKIIVAITKKGQDMLKKFIVWHEEYIEELSGKIGKKELKTIHKALKILLEFNVNR